MSKADDSIEKIAKKIVSLGLETPALFFLELHKPLYGVFYNLGLVAAPIATPLFGAERVHSLQDLLSDQKNVEALIKKIETYSLNESKKMRQV